MANTVTLLGAVTKCAANEGKARDQVVAAIHAAGDDTPEVRTAYIVGRLMATLSIGEVDARAILDKAGVNAKGDDKPKRTEVQERAYGAARFAWDSVKRAAGIAPEPKKSGARKAAATVRDTSGAPVTIPSLVVPKVKAVADIATYAMALCANVRKFRSVNAAVFKGDDGAAYRDAMDDFVRRIEAVAVKPE